jgi:GPH family glycoside/pentoside/hexuronide:cation symporter
LSGYLQPTDAVPSPVQPASALWAIRILMGPVPALFLLLAIFFAYLYPITREKHEEIRRQLDARRKAMEGQR